MNILEQLSQALTSGAVRVVDLTQPLSPDTPVIGLPDMFAPSPGLTLEEISHYDDKGPAWYWNVLHLGEHTGTHFDAPVHWISGKDLPDNATDTLPPRMFVALANVLDVSAEVARDEGFVLEPQDIEAWEAEHGAIAPGSWVLMRTGWSRRQGQAFLNVKEDGPVSPGPSAAAVRALLERDVLGWGVETVGTDAGAAASFEPPFPAHTLLHGAGKLGLASLCNLDRLPPKGAIIIAAPLKVVGGSGSPVRALALVSS
jgi:kynurenine formamidase